MKMSKWSKKILSLAVVFCLTVIMCIGCINVMIAEGIDLKSKESVQLPNVSQVASTTNDDTRINEYEQIITVTFEDELETDSVKELRDFNERKYTLIETNPSGYFIFEDDSKTLIEGAPKSPSPYLNQYSNLYYGGPQQYYAKKMTRSNGDSFVHTILGTEIEIGRAHV